MKKPKIDFEAFIPIDTKIEFKDGTISFSGFSIKGDDWLSFRAFLIEYKKNIIKEIAAKTEVVKK